jgi:sugar diacid utilization regulator
LEIGIDTGLRFYGRNRQELISAIGITGIPRSIGKESFFNEFVTSMAQLMTVKYRHGFFDDVESPA